MIVTAPSGSYLTVLPKDHLDPTSVIYTISAGPPPRDQSPYQKIPNGIKDMRRPVREFTDQTRRGTLGDLVYTTKMANPVKALNGAKLFGYGEILDFVDEAPVVITSTAVSDNITTKHNSNYVDLFNLGLDATEQTDLANEATIAQHQLLLQIGDLQKQRSSLEIDISGLQGQINEATKIVVGLNAVLIAAPGSKMVATRDKVQTKVDSLKDKLIQVSAAYNKIPDQINILRSSLGALTDLVK